jgi:hypothetical protein
MSLPTNIRVKIVLLMAKFESPVIVKRKLQADFGKMHQVKLALQLHNNAFVKLVQCKIENVLEDHQKLRKIDYKRDFV